MSWIKVTKKQIPIDVFLYEKLKLMIQRCVQEKPRWDTVLAIDGTEGIGKTTLSVTLGYIAGKEMGRKFSESNVFADVDEGIKFAQSTEKQIIIFDEPSSDALSVEFRNKIQINLIKLLMQVRKRRHFIIFNFTKFYKFAEYLVVDRPIGMIHIYLESNNKPAWVYIPGMNLEILYNDYRFKKQRNYKKYYTIHGYFEDILDPDKEYNILDEFNVEKYEKNKDKAIEMIGKKKKLEEQVSELKLFKRKVGLLKPSKNNPIDSVVELARRLGVTRKTLNLWVKNEEEESEGEVKG